MNKNKDEKWDYLFNTKLSQPEKLALMETLFQEKNSLEKNELNALTILSVEKRDIHVLGYCLALEADNNEIENKEDLFLMVTKKEFIQGMQLLSHHVNLEEQYQSSRHKNSSQNLLNHALTYAIEHTNPKPAVRFLLNKGAKIDFDNNALFVYAYENDFMLGVEYLIKNHNVNIRIIKIDITDINPKKMQLIENWYKEHQFDLTQTEFVMKELPANVTRRKI